MHYGVFEGKNAKDQSARILILGESHHISTKTDVTENKTEGIPASYTTASVVQEHLESLKNEKQAIMHPFFTKIAQTLSAADEDAFWQSVYFGNYIDVLCGIGNSVARKQIDKMDAGKRNREKYNDQLFQFVNEHKIEKIFCFSILAYKSLPLTGDGEKSIWETIGMRGNRRVFLRQCRFQAGIPHKGTGVILQKDLHVYGISHPQAKGGYACEMYAAALKNAL